jgi:hypothetical protein
MEGYVTVLEIFYSFASSALSLLDQPVLFVDPVLVGAFFLSEYRASYCGNVSADGK